jgi:hypothetical protein
MTPDPENSFEPAEEGKEKPLCVSCMAPNEPFTHFCAHCGAPLTSYASTGPLESVFAEGAMLRQATGRPRRLIVVLGVWLLFGTTGLMSLILLVMDQGEEMGATAFCVLLLAFSVWLIWKTTRNYSARGKNAEEKHDD